jgi:hypothetical protein
MVRKSEGPEETKRQPITYGPLLDEYKEVNSNLRHYSNMRFERINVFLIANGALSWAQLFREPPHGLGWLVPTVGVLVVFTFWLTVYRVEAYYGNIRRRAIALEQQLGFRQISELPTRRIFTTRSATHVLFLSFFLLWAFLFLRAAF